MRIDVLTQKVREGDGTVNVLCLIGAGVNTDGSSEILGIDETPSEDGAGVAGLAFLRGMTVRGLSGGAMVTATATRLVSAIATPGAVRVQTADALTSSDPSRHTLGT